MNKNTIQSALQIVATVSALVGAIMTSSAILAVVGFSRSVARMELGSSQVGSGATSTLTFGVLSAAMPLLWGAVLYFASPKIAAHIHNGQS